MTVPIAWQALVDLDTEAGVLSLYSWAGGALPIAGETFLVEPMSFGWARAQGAPTQPEPVECRFSMLVPGPVLVDIGRRVSVRLIDYATSNELVGFHGRVTDVATTPVEYFVDGGVEHGTYVDVIAVDPIVDLAEAPCTTAALPADTAGDRAQEYIHAIAADDMPAGWDPAFQGIGGHAVALDSWVQVKAEDPASGQALERLVALCDQVGLGWVPNGLPEDDARSDPATALDRRLASRAIIAPRINATVLPWVYPDTTEAQGSWYTFDEPSPFYDSDDPADFPAVLTAGPDGYALVIDTASPLVVDAGRVDFGAKFTRNKFTHPNRATVTYTPDGSSDPTTATVDADDRDTADPIVAVALDAPLLGAILPTYPQTDDYGPRRMALMYLPETDARDRWQADAFRYYPDDWTRLRHAPWFPRHHSVDLISPGTVPGDPDDRASCYTHPVVVDGIIAAHNPTGRAWYAGELNSVLITLAGPQPVVEFTLKRVLPVPTGSGALTVGDVDPAITVGDLDPAFTFYDYRLARGFA